MRDRSRSFADYGIERGILAAVLPAGRVSCLDRRVPTTALLRRLFFLLGLILSPILAARGEDLPPSGDHAFLILAGKVGESSPIQMQLMREPGDTGGNSMLHGSYHYLSQRKTLELSGRLRYDDSFELEESLPVVDAKSTGSFTGKWQDGDDGGAIRLTGTWTSADGKRKLPFTLQQVQPEGSAALDFHYFEESYGRKRGGGYFERRSSLLFPQVRGTSGAASAVNAALRRIADGREEGEEAPRKEVPTLVQLENSVLAPMPDADQRAEMEISYSSSETYDDLFRIQLNAAGLLCIRHFHTEYTGGAHGNHWASHVTLDLSTGRQVTLEELLTPEPKAQLTRLAEAALREFYGLKPGEALNSDNGPLFENKFELNDNWFLTPGGLGFCFIPYEIGPYAAGFIEPVIPWEQLKPLIREGSPLEKLAGKKPE